MCTTWRHSYVPSVIRVDDVCGVHPTTQGVKKPFDEILYCNIGNPQQLNQPPITFTRQVLTRLLVIRVSLPLIHRLMSGGGRADECVCAFVYPLCLSWKSPHSQVMSLLEWTALLEDPRASEIFPADAIARAKSLRSAIPGGIGAYSDSRGIEAIRQNVADFIARRDGCVVPSTPLPLSPYWTPRCITGVWPHIHSSPRYPCDVKNIFLSDGATPAITRCIHMLLRDSNDAVESPFFVHPLAQEGARIMFVSIDSIECLSVSVLVSMSECVGPLCLWVLCAMYLHKNASADYDPYSPVPSVHCQCSIAGWQSRILLP